MIIFAKADGTVIETKPTPFYQGSSLKGSINLVAPFPNTNGVTIQFHLPNGNVTKAYPMTPTGEVEGVMLDGYEVSAWTWDVKNAMVTALPGVVTATITVFNGEPNITYYGDYATLTAITNIDNPQTNAYAYCKADGNIYKYNGSGWEVSNITISANDYVKTTIISSFPIIKGTPNALDVNPPETEWEAIISALNEIGGKVTKPLMTNFTYNIATGESEKTYNNGMVQTENFPAVLPDTMTEYQSFTRTVFFAENWETSDRGDYSYMLTMPFSTYSDEFDIAIYSVFESGYLKMNPFTTINRSGVSRVVIYSNDAYSGYALFFWKGSFAEQNYKEAIEKAIDDCEGATAQAENIANTLETAYENGEFVGPQGPQGLQGATGPQGPQGPQGVGIPSGGTAGQILTKTENGTAWEDAPSGGGSGGGSTFLYLCQGMYDYAGPQFKFWIPIFGGVKKIEVLALNYCDTSAGVLLSYQEIITDSVIYENGTKSNFFASVVGTMVEWNYGENSMWFAISGNFVEQEAGTYPQLVLKITM